MLEETENNSANEKAALMQEIQGAIWEVAEKKEIEKVRSLSRHSPEKVASILYLYSTGSSQTRIVRKYGINRASISIPTAVGTISSANPEGGYGMR